MMAKKNDFVLSNESVRHELDTPSGELIVYVRPISWIQQQEALSRFVDFSSNGDDGNIAPKIDLGGYWRYVFTNCIDRTEPVLSNEELLNLRPEVGAEIQKVLPSIFEIVGSFAGGDSPLA
jgi:hypothetical protein|tara:strand:+ start:420 stop:782 length:363 start_codon:yes stop_codon:yes gene_type:complete